ncbi:MAG TPA: hypothetical protein VFE04_01625 [Puia sp.]|nr:hypothetical protein [Puia sp.]
MKNPLVPLLALCATFQANAQEARQDFMAVPIISQQSFYLKAASPGSKGSGSNQVLQINLPANTVEWYYTVTTKPGHGQFPNNDLTGQLVKLVDPRRGISSKASVHVPAGTSVVDVYLMTNTQEVHKYVNKRPADSFLMNDSREHYVSGAIAVKDYLDGSCFLVVLNPGPSNGVNVNIEVTAIVLSPVGTSTAMQ